MSYGGSGIVISLPSQPDVKPTSSLPTLDSSGPNFAKMSAGERLTYHQERLKRLFGENR